MNSEPRHDTGDNTESARAGYEARRQERATGAPGLAGVERYLSTESARRGRHRAKHPEPHGEQSHDEDGDQS